ncbi:universal stress protein [Occallatibacter savannae]|uniref:universal stress protein n=1 Tax=Occallatibacter savannae TaxID=1002691 RepID=UPI003B83A2CD
MWCTPEVILGVTTLSDEQALLPHIINQARQSGAKIILAHAQSLQGRQNCRQPPLSRPTLGTRETREALDRLARQLRWLGFTCEPILLSGPPELEIPYLVRSCGVDRVLIGFEEDPDPTTRKTSLLPEQLLRGVDVPVCVIGRNAVHANRVAIRNITLAVSAESSCEVPLSFACRLAQEHRAALNVLHVFDPESDGDRVSTPQEVVARLPFSTWREAELFCPSQVAVREGRPADEILSYCRSTQQDLLILCSPGNTLSEKAWRDGVSYRTIAGAPCPVFIADRHSEVAVALNIPGGPDAQKIPPRAEQTCEVRRKEAMNYQRPK